MEHRSGPRRTAAGIAVGVGGAVLLGVVLGFPRRVAPPAPAASVPEPTGPGFSPELAPLPAPPPAERLVSDLLAGRDPQGLRFLAWLRGGPPASDRRAAVVACAGAWLETRQAVLMVPIREAMEDLAEVAALRLGSDPAGALDLIATFGLPGGARDDRFFASAALKEALVRACQPGGDPGRDSEAGPLRAKALWIVGRARIREAIPTIRRAAGLVRDEGGLPVPGDPYGPARDQALRIVTGNSRPRSEAPVGQPEVPKAPAQAGRPTTRGRALASSPR